MKLIWPETQVISVLSGILTAIGRNFTINVKQAGTACPNCLGSGYYDPITDMSTYSFCPLCYGSYWLNSVSGLSVLGHVKWLVGEIPRFYPGGIIPDGDCMITVAYSKILQDNIEKAKNFEVDGKKLSLKSYKLRGVKQINRIILTLNEESN